VCRASDARTGGFSDAQAGGCQVDARQSLAYVELSGNHLSAQGCHLDVMISTARER
jgi:hypothetical protein